MEKITKSERETERERDDRKKETEIINHHIDRR